MTLNEKIARWMGCEYVTPEFDKDPRDSAVLREYLTEKVEYFYSGYYDGSYYAEIRSAGRGSISCYSDKSEYRALALAVEKLIRLGQTEGAVKATQDGWKEWDGKCDRGA